MCVSRLFEALTAQDCTNIALFVCSATSRTYEYIYYNIKLWLNNMLLHKFTIFILRRERKIYLNRATLQLRKTGFIRAGPVVQLLQPLPGGADIPGTSVNLGGVTLASTS